MASVEASARRGRPSVTDCGIGARRAYAAPLASKTLASQMYRRGLAALVFSRKLPESETAMSPYQMSSTEERLDQDPSPKPRRWRAKFRDALRGLKLGIRGHSSFFVHFFIAALVVAGAGMLRCTVEQWCLLLL